MEINLLKDAEFIKKLNEQNLKTFHVKMLVLDKDELPIRAIEGRVSAGSITVSSNSPVRRAANITFQAEEAENDLTDIDNLLSINKKVKILVGLDNNIDSRYDKIVWFNQGIYVIALPSLTHNASGVSIGLQLKDKMALLNGELGGGLPTSVTFHEYDQIVGGLYDLESLPKNPNDYTVYQLITTNTWVTHIEEIPAQPERTAYYLGSVRTGIYRDKDGKPETEVIYYTADNDPEYEHYKEAWQRHKNNNDGAIRICNLDGTMKMWGVPDTNGYYAYGETVPATEAVPAKDIEHSETKINYYMWNSSDGWYEVDDDSTVGSVITCKNKVFDIIQTLVCFYGGESIDKIQIEGVPLELKQLVRYVGTGILRYNVETKEFDTVEKEADDPTYRYFKYNEDCGYEYVDFTYPGELVSSIGNSITSVLDQMVNTLGNYEYYYDIDGHFVFKEISNYLNTQYDPVQTRKREYSLSDEGLLLSAENYYLDLNNTSSSIYTFEQSNNLISAFTNSPNYSTVKNDYHIWGENSNKYPIHYHLAIKKKPQEFGTYSVVDDYTSEVEITVTKTTDLASLNYELYAGHVPKSLTDDNASEPLYLIQKIDKEKVEDMKFLCIKIPEQVRTYGVMYDTAVDGRTLYFCFSPTYLSGDIPPELLANKYTAVDFNGTAYKTTYSFRANKRWAAMDNAIIIFDHKNKKVIFFKPEEIQGAEIKTYTALDYEPTEDGDLPQWVHLVYDLEDEVTNCTRAYVQIPRVAGDATTEWSTSRDNPTLSLQFYKRGEPRTKEETLYTPYYGGNPITNFYGLRGNKLYGGSKALLTFDHSTKIVDIKPIEEDLMNSIIEVAGEGEKTEKKVERNYTGKIRLAVDGDSANDIYEYTPTDWRAELYMRGLQKKALQIRPSMHEEELLDLFDSIYDMKERKFKVENVNNPNELSYWIDYIVPSELFDVSIDSIGDKIYSYQQDSIRKLYTTEAPDVCILNGFDKNYEHTDKMVKKFEAEGQDYSKVSNDLYLNLAVGTVGYTSQEVGRNLLYQYTAPLSSITLTTIPIYCLDINSRITVNDRVSGIHGDYIINTLNIPLDARQTMTINATRAYRRD